MRTNRIIILILAFLAGFLGFEPLLGAQTAEEHFYRGNDLGRQGLYEDAIEEYKRSLKLNPSATVVYYNLGLACKKLGRHLEAAAALEEALRLEPQYLPAQVAMGSVYNLMERWEDAIAHLNVAVHRETGNAEAHGNLGWAYYNYKGKPPFKFLTIVNLKKAADLFEAQGLPQAAQATRKVLEEALVKYGFVSKN
ncbi:MAG: tetratricopeptide repeat protein [Nitrospinae bacterium]|nr:tetratricopeptide repeat protein [Nitrospinota bacterium]